MKKIVNEVQRTEEIITYESVDGKNLKQKKTVRDGKNLMNVQFVCLLIKSHKLKQVVKALELWDQRKTQLSF